jgi:hypothetical protein
MLSGVENEEYMRFLLVLHNRLKNLIGDDEFINKTCHKCLKNNKQIYSNDCKLYYNRILSSIGFPSNFIRTGTGYIDLLSTTKTNERLCSVSAVENVTKLETCEE